MSEPSTNLSKSPGIGTSRPKQKFRFPTIAFMALLATACNRERIEAEFANINVYHRGEKGRLTVRTPDEARTKAVHVGQITNIYLSRLCFKTIEGLGKRPLSASVTIRQGQGSSAKEAKGVIEVERIGDDSCIQARNKQLVDPFPFERATYTIQIDIVALPSDSAVTLKRLVQKIGATAKIAGPEAASVAKIGTALFDTFIAPEIDNAKVRIKYEQSFDAAGLSLNQASGATIMQNGNLVVIPRKFLFENDTGNGIEIKAEHIDPSQVYVDSQWNLRRVSASSPSESDEYYDDAPYIILRIAAGWRTAADQEVSQKLRDMLPLLRTGVVKDAKESIASLRTLLARKAPEITSPVMAMYGEVLDALESYAFTLSKNEQPLALVGALRAAKDDLETVTRKYRLSDKDVGLEYQESAVLIALLDDIQRRANVIKSDAEKAGQQAILRARDAQEAYNKLIVGIPVQKRARNDIAAALVDPAGAEETEVLDRAKFDPDQLARAQAQLRDIDLEIATAAAVVAAAEALITSNQ